MQLLKPEASELPTRKQKNAQEQPVEPGRTILLFEHAAEVGDVIVTQKRIKSIESQQATVSAQALST